MNQKPSPLAALAAITPEQADELFDRLRTAPYYAAVAWVAETWGMSVSISGLRRWWLRESSARARADLRAAIRASEQFDKDLDARALDQRAAHAMRAKFWQAVTSGDKKATLDFGAAVLDYNADGRDDEKLQRVLAAERERDAAKAEASALRARVSELEAALAAAGRDSAADPKAVMAEVDRILGRKTA
jgi:hypothetical protein